MTRSWTGCSIARRISPICVDRSRASGCRRMAPGLPSASKRGGGKPAWFDAGARRLIARSPPGDMRPADTSGLPLRDWRNDLAPKLAGKPLKLERNETSRSLAIAPDRRSFVLGTDWYLRRFGAGGEEVWSVALPAAAWAAGVSGDGRVAVAALANGTIRWYRFEDGRRYWPCSCRGTANAGSCGHPTVTMMHRREVKI